jgi:ADP-ribose pyrophosphatase YjhB (NUDIX family)
MIPGNIMTIKKTIAIYQEVYGLPVLECEEQVPEGFFNFYKKKHYFAVISIYNPKKEHLLLRDFNKNVGWELPGGSIKEGEGIADVINRITSNEIGFEIDELTPVAIVKNIFTCGDKRITHLGIAFMALSRGKGKIYSKNIQTHFTKQIPGKIAYQNGRILSIVKKRVDGKKHKPPFEEIENIKSKNFSIFYFLHKYIVRHVGNFSSRKIKSTIFNLIDGKPKTILDASCGDSSIINDLCSCYKPEICIGNDISWKTIMLMKKSRENVIFTNHNILDLPYNTKFDLVLFKNTLHHIDKKYQEKVLKDLQKLAKQLIIVDVDDPQNSSLLSRLWNKYYVYLLGDQGDAFLKFKEFDNLIEVGNTNNRLRTGTINTIKGRYFFGKVIEKNISPEISGELIRSGENDKRLIRIQH